jgi:hypothetical protein
LDLNGDGVKTLGYSAGVKFDLFASGTAVNTGWVSSSDGLLVMDRNHDGVIDSGAELFGAATTLANGSQATDGYAALRELDTDGNAVVNAKDAGFADLRVWVDGNSDGVSQTAELKTLAALDISSLSLQTQTGVAKDNGNVLGLTSTYQTADGANHAAADVWFVADKAVIGSEAKAQGASGMDARTSEIAQVISAFATGESAVTWSASGAATPLATGTPVSGSTVVLGMAETLDRFNASNQGLDKLAHMATPLAPLQVDAAVAPPTILVAPG